MAQNGSKLQTQRLTSTCLPNPSAKSTKCACYMYNNAERKIQAEKLPYEMCDQLTMSRSLYMFGVSFNHSCMVHTRPGRTLLYTVNLGYLYWHSNHCIVVVLWLTRYDIIPFKSSRMMYFWMMWKWFWHSFLITCRDNGLVVECFILWCNTMM